MPAAPDFTLSPQQLVAFHERPHQVVVEDAAFRLEGPGTIDCLQGLLTNDVKHLPLSHAVWGAVLTPKGMIISDAWVLRDTNGAWVLVPGRARDTIGQLFTRTVPPRLSRVVDRTDTSRVVWTIGGVPQSSADVQVFTPRSIAPFATVAVRDAAVSPPVPDGPGTAHYADVSKLLLGWPTLGREIDERTLPQEVRFDELDGVRYDKGCYTGQETVARLHFRGHANRVLRAVSWAPGEMPTDRDVNDGEKSVGTLRTVAQLGDRTVALAVLRREVAAGDTVRTGDTEGVVTDPPFDWNELTAA